MTLEELFGGRHVDVAASQARLARLMADEGLPYRDRTHTYNSRLAQELAKWAEQQPRGEAIHDTLYRAYFVEGANLARIDELVRIAGGLGLPASEAREVLETRRCSTAVDRDWARSVVLGITGVPTFVAGGKGVVGAQPYEVLERLAIDAGAERTE